MSKFKAVSYVFALLLVLTGQGRAQLNNATSNITETRSGPCDYLEAGPGLGPLKRDVQAALRGEATEFVVGALGIKGSVGLYKEFNATFST